MIAGIAAPPAAYEDEPVTPLDTAIGRLKSTVGGRAARAGPGGRVRTCSTGDTASWLRMVLSENTN